MPLVGEPIVEWAVWYATVLGWRIIPCRGKRALVEDWRNAASSDEAQIRAWWAQHMNANIAVLMGHGLMTVDVDEEKGGPASLTELCAVAGETMPPTTTSQTGSGGESRHYLFRTDEPVRKQVAFRPGVDIQGEGSYIIVPPSVTKYRYTWLEEIEYGCGPDETPPQPLPPWLLALLAQPSTNGTGGGHAAEDDGGPIYKGERETRLMSIGGKLLHGGKTPAEVFDGMDTANSTRCIPALDAADVKRLVGNLYKYDAIHKAEKAAQKEAEAQLIVTTQAVPIGWTVHRGANDAPASPPPSPGAWLEQLFTFKNGEVKQNVTNFKMILQNHPYWHSATTRLWWDSVRALPMSGEHDIDDGMILDIADWFGRTMRLPITRTDLLRENIVSECKKYKRDLLREWLEGLPAWDKRRRLHSWLKTYAGVEPSAYTEDVSRVIPVSMVARVMQPGCHYRFVAILKGEEDIGKSLLIKVLCGPTWYVDLGLNLDNKEAHMMLQGVWVAELGELHSMGRTEETRLKSFITMDEDSYIPKYGNFRETTERRAIFIGTTNQDVFLKETGNTRFLPVELHGECDRAGLSKIREQLFAEAMDYYHGHPEDWWDLSEEGHALAHEQRELRRVMNPYEQKLHEWLEYERWHTTYYPENSTIPVTFTQNETHWPEIAQWCLGLRTAADWKDRGLQMQVASALRALGWRVRQVWRLGRNTKVWRKEEPTPF